MKRLRVLVLMHHHLIPPEDAGPHNREGADWMTEYDVLEALETLGHQVVPLGLDDELTPIKPALEEHRPHIAFNLLTFFHGVGTYDAYVVSYLELLKTVYTGSNPRGILLCGDKALSKKILAYHRIRSPSFATFKWGRKIRRSSKLPFPLIVKSPVEHASLGIAQASIVHDDDALAERIEFVHRHLGTDAIAEQYVPGREFTVTVLGNERLTTYPIWELSFENLPEGNEPIATHRVKWDLEYQEKVGAVIGPARNLPEDKEREIVRIAKRTYRALELSGFARIDLRLREDGRLFVLEANPNPQLARGEEVAEATAYAGLKYEDLIQKVLNLGLAYKPEWKV